VNDPLIEYINLHIISLKQDLEDAQNNIPVSEDEYFESDSYYNGAIETAEHILDMARQFDEQSLYMVG